MSGELGELVGMVRTPTYLVSKVLCVEDSKNFLYVHCEVLSSIPGLYPLDAGTLTQFGKPKMFPEGPPQWSTG